MSIPVNDQYKALMAKALLELRELRARLNEKEEAKSEPIAIIGMGCRFPGAYNPESFWHLLENGSDGVSEVPASRWDIEGFYDPDPDKPGKMYTRFGGFLKTVDTFDADFFAITPREAVRIDPQQRLLLEVAWEALEYAGIAPESLFGSSTGVFVGISSFDYATLQLGLHNAGRIDAYVGTGIALNAANGRLSYTLGLNGPSMAVDTACSSSLTALHLACQSLRNHECGMALAGGVNLILIPELTINFCRARMLAPDGRCKTFDAAADGYVRGEGCGVVVLKRLSDAEADGDTVSAIIRGSAVNQDGSSGGLTVPSGPSQEAVILRALENGRVRPDQVSYVEAHGTGTSLGDPIEARSMGKVFGGRSREHPLMVGSVKTNFGHLEAASGMAGLLKVVLSMMHGKIPAHLHFRNPSPHILWNELPLEVPTELREWPSLERPRIAGVSSFGFSGTNAHVVIEEAPMQNRTVNHDPHPAPGLLTLSAKSGEALEEMVRTYGNYLADHPDLSLGDICYTSNTGRSHFSHRLAICAFSTPELIDKLTAVMNGEMRKGVFRGRKGGDQSFLSMKREAEDLSELLLLWGDKYAGGASLDWKEFYKKYKCSKISLPTYPFQKQRYWIEANQAESVETGHHVLNPLLGRRLNLPGAKENRFETRISAHAPSFLDHHRIFGAAVFPAAAYFEMALAAGSSVFGPGNLCLSEMFILQALIMPESGNTMLHLVLKSEGKDRGAFRIFSRPREGEWILHAVGNILAENGGLFQPPVDLRVIRERCAEKIPVQDYYRGLKKTGLELGPLFQGIKELRCSGSEALGCLQLPDSLFYKKGKYVLHPVRIDSCMQLLGAVIPEKGKSQTWLPVGLKKLRMNLSVDAFQPDTSLWCHAMIYPLSETGSPELSSSLLMFDDKGNLIVSVEGLTLRKANREALLPEMAKNRNDGSAASSKQLSRNEIQAPQSEILRKVRNASRQELKGILLAYIRDLSAEIMGLGALRKVLPDRPLMEQGFDSLMAVELKNMLERDLGKQLPAGLVFNYPSLNEICAYIEEEFFVRIEESGAGLHGEERDEFAYLNDIDRGELEALIRKEVL